MDQKETRSEQELEISLKQILMAVWQRIWLVALVAVLCGAVAFVGSYFILTPQYQSSATFYVNNGNSSPGTSMSITTGDITAAKSLVDSYIIILNTRESMEAAVEYAELDLSYDQVKSMISAASVNGTEFFKVTVTNPDPVVARKLAKAIAQVLPNRIAEMVEGSSVKVVEAPVLAKEPSSPNVLVNTVLLFVLGGFLAVVAILLHEIFDITVHTEEDITATCEYPILTEVPDMSAPVKGGAYSSGKKNVPASSSKELLCDRLSFSASEAYKLLRTKLEFSFADENNCRIIGMASALAGEGKSLSCCNLAYTLAELDKRVLLIECDMRRPSLSNKLPVRRVPGLSNYLTGHAALDELTQRCVWENTGVSFDVIAGGRNPPNPIELLSSQRMMDTLQVLRTRYDYILLDLPPVGEVSDALVAGKLTDGILLVVRQDHCDRKVLADAVQQFDFVGAKILGIVFNGIHEMGKGNRKYYYYSRSYAKAADRSRKKAGMQQNRR